ncbi:isochorismate synthase [Longimycelium tulufanense]|nr:isochorismate synthase [Longimycelium tulufanense]
MITQPTAAATHADDLLAAYQHDDFFLASPKGTLLCRGRRATVSLQDGSAPFGEQLRAAVDTSDDPATQPAIAVGALPFDTYRPAELVVPHTVHRGGPLPARSDEPDQGIGIPQWNTETIPDAAAHQHAVAQAVQQIRSGAIDKVVLARVIRLTTAQPLGGRVRRILRNLAARDPRCYTFAAALPSTAGTRTLVGASPELLLSRSGTTVMTNPLAGSAARSPDPAEDRRRAEALLASAKDRREHTVVVEAVVENLRPLLRDLRVPSHPSLVCTATMWHLSTVITGQVADADIAAVDLARALHPTPAVCGTPTDRARATIGELEPFDRGFYAGTLGWCDATGDGEWVVTIRCAEVGDHELRLFAGGGIVGDSDPAAEVAETSAKLRTLLRAMGVHQEL